MKEEQAIKRSLQQHFLFTLFSTEGPLLKAFFLGERERVVPIADGKVYSLLYSTKAKQAARMYFSKSYLGVSFALTW